MIVMSLLLALYAIQSTQQKSRDWSQNDMFFGRNVHGLLKLRQENWMDEETIDLSEYVKKMRETKKIYAFSKINLIVTQNQMKLHYDGNCFEEV